jgi:hypothetical protein
MFGVQVQVGMLPPAAWTGRDTSAPSLLVAACSVVQSAASSPASLAMSGMDVE